MKERIAYRSTLEGFAKSRLPQFTSEQVSYIRGTADFLGVNHYTSDIILAIQEPAVSDPSYHFDKGYNTYKDESWPGAASDWLKVNENFIKYCRYLMLFILGCSRRFSFITSVAEKRIRQS